MANDFNSFTGGLVNSVVANVGNQVTSSIQNIGNPNPSSGGWASFSVNSLLGSTIQTTTGYALNAGENYLMSQLGSVLPRGENNQLLNAVATQIASAGVSQLSGFVSQGVSNLLSGGSTVTTAGLAGQAARGSISIPDSVVQNLPAAEYGGTTYTLEDIVFTLVPANAGAQTAPQPESKALVPLDVAFDPKVDLGSKSLDSLKAGTSLAYPATGFTSGFGNTTTLVETPSINTTKINPAW